MIICYLRQNISHQNKYTPYFINSILLCSGFTTGDSRHTFAQLVVKVTDVNDQAPIFKKESNNFESRAELNEGFVANEGCAAVITEFHDAISDGAILTVRADDGDDPASPNGRLDFEIVDGNELGLFR